MWNVEVLNSAQELETFLNTLVVADEIEEIVVAGGIFTVIYFTVV